MAHPDDLNAYEIAARANAKLAIDPCSTTAFDALAGFMYRKPEHQPWGTTFLRGAPGLGEPAAADILR